MKLWISLQATKPLAKGWHPSRFMFLEKGIRAMTKTLETMNDAVKNPKHSFKKADHQPKKAMKHRYERRKIKEYLHLGDWLTEEMI